MNDSLILTKDIVKTITNESIQCVEEENQNKEYEGISFSIGHRTYRSRLAKRTPKKAGTLLHSGKKAQPVKIRLINMTAVPTS